jgi:agmatine deiminase
VEEDPKDENYEVLQDNLKRVKRLKDQDGRPFEIVDIPMPGRVEHDGQRLPATYVNFYFVNGALLVPTFRNRRNDRRALSILQERLPGRKVIGIDCLELIWGLGAIHCLSQQQPKI